MEHLDKLDHDVGFLFHITSGANYLITKNVKSRNTNLIAASILASRFNIEGNYIRAWGNKTGDALGENVEGYTIIDTMMNIPLLFWASRESGDRRFDAIAERHAEMAFREHVRSDGSVVHIAVHNTKTSEVIKTLAGQGCTEGSAWSRGATWVIYGFALAYAWKNFLTQQKRRHIILFFPF